MLLEPTETLLVVGLEKFELVEYCSVYPEAFATLPTVTAIELELVALALRDGVAKRSGKGSENTIVCVPAAFVAEIGNVTDSESV